MKKKTIPLGEIKEQIEACYDGFTNNGQHHDPNTIVLLLGGMSDTLDADETRRMRVGVRLRGTNQSLPALIVSAMGNPNFKEACMTAVASLICCDPEAFVRFQELVDGVLEEGAIRCERIPEPQSEA